MIFKSIQYGLPVADEHFDKIYPKQIQKLSDIHWSAIEVSRKAAKFLVTRPGVKVLDIGSGVGKFCIIGSLTTQGEFYGAEYRKDLVDLSRRIVSENQLPRISFIHSNIVDMQFSGYDAFYFFNSFYENLDKERQIDLKVKVSLNMYAKYRDHMFMQLVHAPQGTRVVTHSGLDAEIPSCYKLKITDSLSDLKFWIKEESPKLLYV